SSLPLPPSSHPPSPPPLPPAPTLLTTDEILDLFAANVDGCGRIPDNLIENAEAAKRAALAAAAAAPSTATSSTSIQTPPSTSSTSLLIYPPIQMPPSSSIQTPPSSSTTDPSIQIPLSSSSTSLLVPSVIHRSPTSSGNAPPSPSFILQSYPPPVQLPSSISVLGWNPSTLLQMTSSQTPSSSSSTSSPIFAVPALPPHRSPSSSNRSFPSINAPKRKLSGQPLSSIHTTPPKARSQSMDGDGSSMNDQPSSSSSSAPVEPLVRIVPSFPRPPTNTTSADFCRFLMQYNIQEEDAEFSMKALESLHKKIKEKP
ncbi:hypothetical protein PENTCL1PPCAC_27357, partial [Pristionchus entomophagus]